MRSSQPTTPSPTSAATTVAEIGFDIEASWNTVSGSTASADPARRSPKPFVQTTASSWTTPIASPGTSPAATRSAAIASIRATAASTRSRGTGPAKAGAATTASSKAIPAARSNIPCPSVPSRDWPDSVPRGNTPRRVVDLVL